MVFSVTQNPLSQNSLRYACLLVFLTIALSACNSTSAKRADLQVIYTQSAQYHLPDRNPVIVIPGILGSRLVDSRSGRTVWGAFEPETVNPARAEDAKLIALPIAAEKPLSELTDEVVPDGVLDRVRVNFLGVPVDIRAYVGILSTLGVGGYRDESLGLGAVDYGDDHFTCFQFDYDWRRDNVENAKRFKMFLDEKRAYVKAQYKQRYGIDDADVKFDVVAHSMGGLMLRYFLRYGDADLAEIDQNAVDWAGARDIDRAILIATPSGGSVLSFEQLVKGYDVARPILPRYPAALLATYPSIYQLLPRPRHGAYVFDDDPDQPIDEIYDARLWEKYGWGLAAKDEASQKVIAAALPEVDDPEQRQRIALSLQAIILDRAKQFHAALDIPAAPPETLEIFLVSGDALDTPKTVSVNRQSGDIQVIEKGPGDGTVLRSSALMDERENGDWEPQLRSPISWSSVLFLASNHLGLTEDPAFVDNVLFWLLEEPRDP